MNLTDMNPRFEIARQKKVIVSVRGVVSVRNSQKFSTVRTKDAISARTQRFNLQPVQPSFCSASAFNSTVSAMHNTCACPTCYA